MTRGTAADRTRRDDPAVIGITVIGITVIGITVIGITANALALRLAPAYAPEVSGDEPSAYSRQLLRSFLDSTAHLGAASQVRVLQALKRVTEHRDARLKLARQTSSKP